MSVCFVLCSFNSKSSLCPVALGHCLVFPFATSASGGCLGSAIFLLRTGNRRRMKQLTKRIWRSNKPILSAIRKASLLVWALLGYAPQRLGQGVYSSLCEECCQRLMKATLRCESCSLTPFLCILLYCALQALLCTAGSIGTLLFQLIWTSIPWLVHTGRAGVTVGPLETFALPATILSRLFCWF